MTCKGHQGNRECWLPANPKSFWGLCESCNRIENRLFLEAVQQAIRANQSIFRFHDKDYSLDDENFPNKYLRYTVFTPSHQDPRLSLLALTYSNRPACVLPMLKAFLKDSGFLLSSNLLYRKHLPQRHTCAILNLIQSHSRQHFLDLPNCPCCISRILTRLGKELSNRQIQHISSIFGNQILAQHPTWFVHIFRLLQTIWEQNLEDIFHFPYLSRYLEHENPIQHQIDLRDWLGAFLETPIVVEKILTGKISSINRAYLFERTGQEINTAFLKRFARGKHYVYREDLIIKTWHPDRLFGWCFDLEEIREFGF